MMVDALQRPWQVDALLDRRVDGFVVVAPELTDFPLPESVAAVPTVMVNCLDPSLGASSLVPDEVGAGAAAAQHLLDSGHRPARGGGGHGGAVLGTSGARRPARGARTPACRTRSCCGPATRSTTATPPRAGCSSPTTPPSALVCVHERLALGALLAVTDLGLNVPDDLSLVSLDDGENLAGRLVPAVDLVERPDAVIAMHALELLVEQLRHGDPAVRRLTFVCPVRPGGSVAPPRLRAARPQPASGVLRRGVRAQGRASVQPSTIPGSASTTQRLVGVG